ncbi:hypothetical protein [Vibrio alginolyticus]|uniref:hypothetical protein n=1 Tax=Vibrio alginolyticus TaxID=663 RepID=UPI0015F5577E|nr:hypothetical protein [Vibrio alginolyticus]EJE4208622.1 hypothetical protein [Vibrio parahaemolyticus]
MNNTTLVNTLTLLAIRYALNVSDNNIPEEDERERFDGSELDIELENRTYEYLCELFALDVAEDELWNSFNSTATAPERCKFAINQLLEAFREQLPQCEKLYATIPNWNDLNEIAMQPIEQLSVKLYQESDLPSTLVNLIGRLDTKVFTDTNETIIQIRG